MPPETDLRAGEGASPAGSWERSRQGSPRAPARQGHEPGCQGPCGVWGEGRGEGLRLVGLGEGCVELGFDSR